MAASSPPKRAAPRTGKAPARKAPSSPAPRRRTAPGKAAQGSPAHAAALHRLGLTRPRVMAILNATPDSFSDGGTLSQNLDARIRDVLAQGADILDVGGESTRPGHQVVAAADELRRVLPVLAAIRRIDPHVPVSIDTRKAEVAAAALEAGATFVNDVSGLGDPKMAAVVRNAACPVVLMRSQPIDGDVVEGCALQLERLVSKALAAGLPAHSLILDPGLGFGDPPGRDAQANLALVDGVERYAQGLPVLIGASRKRFIGDLTGEPDASRRVHGSVGVALRAVAAGASIVRVHDVAATVQALATFTAHRVSGEALLE